METSRRRRNSAGANCRFLRAVSTGYQEVASAGETTRLRHSTFGDQRRDHALLAVANWLSGHGGQSSSSCASSLPGTGSKPDSTVALQLLISENVLWIAARCSSSSASDIVEEPAAPAVVVGRLPTAPMPVLQRPRNHSYAPNVRHRGSAAWSPATNPRDRHVGAAPVLCISTCAAAREETNNAEERAPDEIWLALPAGDGSQPEFASASNSHTHCRIFGGSCWHAKNHHRHRPGSIDWLNPNRRRRV